MNKRKTNIWNNIDWITVLLYITLIIFGWLSIYSAVYNDGHQSIFDITQRYGKQLLWISASFILILIVFLIDVKFYSLFAYFIYIATILLLISVLFLGKEVHGARSWFEIGNFRVQPSEFAKVATSIVLAKYMSSYNQKFKKFKNLFTLAIIILTPVVLIFLQNDTGSALVYFAFILVLYREGLSINYIFIGILIAVLFIVSLLVDKLIILFSIEIIAIIIFAFRNKKIKNIIITLITISSATFVVWGINKIFSFNLSFYIVNLIGLTLSTIILSIFAYWNKMNYIFIILGILYSSILFTNSVGYFFNNILEPHQQTRINILLGIKKDPLGTGYNVNQSKIAIGSGGFSGKGFLQGTQTKFNFVPEQSTDFIFCTIGEESGFIGTSIVILLFVSLLMRIIYLAERQRSKFSRIYGYCVASIIFFHFVINIGMTIGITPVIGIPLPFFSYGGSSLWAFTILLFIFIRLDASRLDLFA
ncbi:MAG: rod shape-determining protein RodA [Bacteroidetes bacterium]|nr:rod shape-determining protein RodA [Bacteroidota bacterium]